MGKKLSFIPLFGLLITALVGCNNEGASESQTNSELPHDIQYVDEDAISIHYVRDDSRYQDWGLWMWSTGNEGREFPFNYVDDYGGVAYYPLSEFNGARSLGFIVKELFSVAGDGEWVKDGNKDRFMDLDMLQKDDHRCYNVYLKSGTSSVYTDKERTHLMNAVITCQFENKNSILVETNNTIKSLSIKKNGVEITSKAGGEKHYEVALAEAANIYDIYSASITFEDDTSVSKTVSILKLYDADFDAAYNYDGELGAIYTPAQTKFKVWSPVSQSVELRIYDNGTPTKVDATRGSDAYTAYTMEKGEKGVFSYTLDGDQQGKYYTYFVTNSANPTGTEVVDPYAKSAGVNGLRGMVVDFARTNPTGWDSVDYLEYDRKELTVYETHIAELTCSDTWGGTAANAKKYKGFYETGTTYTKGDKTVKTGFDHIKELGVNAVQIIPFFDQANDETNMSFNWGYNPLNYNVLEGGYSSDPYDGYARIREFKELVKAYNDEDITIIMDVVYNHVNGLNGSNFDVLAPFYYFRYNEKGEASNGSGCGNETASDKYMFRKFMIDSTAFWTSEYKLGGFRFDLMAIHDTETMNQVTASAKAINPHIVIYGEPWAAGTTALPKTLTSAGQAHIEDFVGYGAFNDYLRDSLISGGLSPLYDRAWVTQTKYAVAPNEVVEGLKGHTGSMSDDPDKAVSYVTCHDNYTMHDRVVTADLANDDIPVEKYKSEETIKKMNALAYSIVFTSQGTSFMLAGEEMLRTKILYDADGNPVSAVNKRGETLNIPAVSGNSYNSSYKTNEINYELKVDNLDLFETYQKLIALKQTAAGLKAKEANEIEVLNDGCVIKITVKDGPRTYEVYHKNGVGSKEPTTNNFSILSLLTFGLMGCSNSEASSSSSEYVVNPFSVNTSGYTLYHDTLHKEFNPNSMELEPFETLIIYK